MAETGRCAEALPVLKKASTQSIDKETRRNVGLAIIRCGMTLDKRDAVLDALKWLNQDFGGDAEILYISTHAYSDLASRESLDLARKAPDSSQAHEMQAEALETQGKWEAAAKEYRLIEQRFPDLPGIHYRLGRLLISQPNPPTDMPEQATKEFEEELKINPNNPGAEYILGELARKSSSWDTAAQHFERASKLDPGFGDAWVAWGESLIGMKKFAEAVAPLERAVQLEPQNPAAHYSLAMAYSRSGRKEDSEREFAIHRQMTQKNGASSQTSEPNSN